MSNDREKQLRARRLSARLAGIACFLSVTGCLTFIYMTNWLPDWVPNPVREAIAYLLAWDIMIRDFAGALPWILLAIGVAWVLVTVCMLFIRRLLKIDAGRYQWKIFVMGTLIITCFLSALLTLTGLQMTASIVTHVGPVETEYSGWNTRETDIFRAIQRESHADSDLVSNHTINDGGPVHCWTTTLLPYLGHLPIYDSLDLSKTWDSAENKDEFQTVVEEFHSWSIPYLYRTREEVIHNKDGYALMHYAANSRVIGFGKPLSLDDMQRGLGSTILLGEVIENLQPWGKPGNSRDPALGIGHPMGFGSVDENRCHFLMGDGSMRSLPKSISAELLKSLSDPNFGSGIEEKEF